MGKSVAQAPGAPRVYSAMNAEYGLAIIEISCRITVNVLSAVMAQTTPSSTVTWCAAGQNTEDAALQWVSYIAGMTATTAVH
jgi:hypothetical protein